MSCAMLSGNSEERQKQIDDLDDFIQTTYKRISNITSTLGWTLESVNNQSHTTVTCPFDSGHRIREKILEGHLEKCQWKAEGYAEDELPLSEPCPSASALSTIKFDEQLQDTVLLKAREKNSAPHLEFNQCCPWNVLNRDAITPAAGVGDRLIPRTSDRLMASFTNDERRAIYDYVIANTIKPDIGDDIADMNRPARKDGDHPKTSLLELLAQERNLKRRRAKHRGVHTNKKSQVEILREVINQQMEMYEEYLADISVKEEPKSPNRFDACSLNFHGSDDKKNYQRAATEKYILERSERRYKNDKKSFDRADNVRKFSPTRKSPKRDVSSNRYKKKNRSRSTSRDSGRKHHHKHKRDRSKEKSRKEDEMRRHRQKEEKTWARDEIYQSEVRNDRKKRHRSRDRNNKYGERSRRHEKSDDNYYRDQRKQETDRNHH